MLEIVQLELDLWQALDDATSAPETADVRSLLLSLDRAMEHGELAQQLAIGAEGLARIAAVYAARAESLIWEWESQYNPTEPVVDVEGCTDLFVQSLHLDLSDLIEPLQAVQYPQNRQPPTAIATNNSLVGQVDKSAVLAMVEQLEADDTSILSDVEQKELILALAHTEDISAETSAIADCFANMSLNCLPLVELVRQVRYPVTLEKDLGDLLVKTWLAVLLGDFELEQREDFYSPIGIWVSLPDVAV
ncbi:MAG: hypothetical protein CLLPBCKN_007299 [Chroococcidiopsis cubana SAG 39.79]|uniref:Uncharacterized protein n=1 Tax=Chroococcidiopsis cubana SAG 39.79 TaxID=388085 RepID=A0AB37US14_9CYAN|nr:hypothetical protein [Chroococcidiopsis cubana]MDZ4877864.1 hypothetical protein [Chroococcidiopsis cubana SAG 39.79]RUT14136.1 hypothetical protein DSM107010_06190 [Chroococcidiopsis cubana SAG 39.79]